MNKPKAIGTAAETGVRNYLLDRDYTKLEAHRNVLAGAADQGDVWLRHPQLGLIVFEVKAGNAAKTASYEQCERWYREARTERVNAAGAYAILVTVRAGYSPARAGAWNAWLDWATIEELTGATPPVAIRDHLIRMPLSDLVTLLAS